MRIIDADAVCERCRKSGSICTGKDCEIPSAPTLTQPNEPLTIQQLREMDGEPVWFDTIKRWGIVKVCRDGVFVLTKSGEFEVGRCKYYRRPQEGKNV